MPLRTLDHVNIETTMLESTLRFYTEALGLKAKERPAGRARPGAWIYDEHGVAVVHLSQREPDEVPAGELGTLRGSGAINHIAFAADDIEGFRAHLRRHGVLFTEREIPDVKLQQVYVTDPNGVLVEINFRG